MITPHNKKGIFTLVRMFAYMVGTKYEHRGVKNLT